VLPDLHAERAQAEAAFTTAARRAGLPGEQIEASPEVRRKPVSTELRPAGPSDGLSQLVATLAGGGGRRRKSSARRGAC
jgi:hypothetical protein